ncbi:MAG TPA: NifB/NifX family molybdenum-iron cluster-binding protein [Dissulfurispiraceae bacterium]|nr:NifB/NifX family molybdenum-iron cluster-binding protein [Dissulfurispiraceae bacterium]
MKLCFPVQENQGMESAVYNHFGSAPFFVLVDTESEQVTALGNCDQHHAHGACNPIMALNGEMVDAVVVGGIGGGALMKLNNKGIPVFRAAEGTIRQNVAQFFARELPQFTLQHTCGGHGGASGCAH